MDRILIHDILARGVIGVNDSERLHPQDILVNITVFTDTTHAGKSDDIEDSVNYRTITKKTISIAESAQRFTVEALAEDIANFIFTLAHVKGVQVRVEKPGAVRFARSVGVEIERWKDES
jgi:FolB domain-containing protein